MKDVKCSFFIGRENSKAELCLVPILPAALLNMFLTKSVIQVLLVRGDRSGTFTGI